MDTAVPPAYMYFDKMKPASELLVAATKQAGLQMDRGKLVGSPERLNIFTIEVRPAGSPLYFVRPSSELLSDTTCVRLRQGDVLRLDLEIEAHLGSTLQPADTIILEKGNRMPEDRLRAIQAAVGR